MCFPRHCLLLQRSLEYVKPMFQNLLQFAYLRISGSLSEQGNLKQDLRQKENLKEELWLTGSVGFSGVPLGGWKCSPTGLRLSDFAKLVWLCWTDTESEAKSAHLMVCPITSHRPPLQACLPTEIEAQLSVVLRRL